MARDEPEVLLDQSDGLDLEVQKANAELQMAREEPEVLLNFDWKPYPVLAKLDGVGRGRVLMGVAHFLASPLGLLKSGAEVLRLLESRAVEMERRATEEPVS